MQSSDTRPRPQRYYVFKTGRDDSAQYIEHLLNQNRLFGARLICEITTAEGPALVFEAPV